MATGIYGARQRAALTVLVVGALLIALGLPQMFSVAAQATGPVNSTPTSIGGVIPVIIDGENSGGNRTCAEAGSYANSSARLDQSGANAGVTGPFTWSHDGTYLSWSAAPNTHNGLAVIMKGSDDANVYYYSGSWNGDSGLASPPTGSGPATLSNLTFCWENPTVTTTTSTTSTTSTTTTVPATTTTVSGPETTTTSTLPTTTTTSGGSTSTTLGATTTTALGPEDPELPDTGVGLVLSIASTGLGSILAGSGLLALRAGARARREGFDYGFDPDDRDPWHPDWRD